MTNKLLKQYQDSASAPLAQAISLPFAVYHDDAVYELEREQVFAQEWVFMCCEQEIPHAGDYFATTLAGESIAIIRGQDGNIRALSNICRHRGTPLLDEGLGNIDRLIICPYHAWAYDDQGTLKAAPLKDDGFASGNHCLPNFHVDSWQGLVFVHLGDSPSQTLTERLSGLDGYLQHFDISAFKKAHSAETEHWQSNWKLAMENAMESYHLFQVHKPTLEVTTPTRDAYYVAGSSEWSMTAGKMVDTSNALLKWLSGPYPEVYDHYALIALPPSFVGILTYESFDWIQVLPVSATESQIRSGGLSTSIKQYENRHVKAFTDAFFEEDKVICERVQKGMQSRYTQGGQLFDVERILIDFHQFLSSRLFGTQGDDFYQAPEAQRFLKND